MALGFNYMSSGFLIVDRQLIIIVKHGLQEGVNWEIENCISFLSYCLWHMQPSGVNYVVPSMYALLITSSDGVDNSQILLTTNSTLQNGSSVTLMASKHMQINRLWDVYILAYNCSENILTPMMELSKYYFMTVIVDIQRELMSSG